MFYKKYLKCFGTNLKCFQANVKYLIIQNIMKCLTLFTEKFSCKYLFQHNLRCSQTDLNVSEHSKMFPNKLELFLIIKNIIKCSKLLKMFPKQM